MAPHQLRGLQLDHLHSLSSLTRPPAWWPFINSGPGSRANLGRAPDHHSTTVSPILLLSLPQLLHRAAVANELRKHKGLYK